MALPRIRKPKPLQKIVSTQGYNLPGTLCHDTSARFFLKNDSLTFYTRDPYKTADGNLLLTGLFYSLLPTYHQGGYLMKTDYDGNMLWLKTYDTINPMTLNSIDYFRVLELRDGSILLAGWSNTRSSIDPDLIITKTDKSGNLIWSKVFKSNLWGSGGTGTSGSYYVQQMKQDPFTGDVYLAGPFWTAVKSLIKLDPANGNIIWSKAYLSIGSYDRPFGIDIRQGEVRLFSGFVDYDLYNCYISMFRINKSTGDTIQAKYFRLKDTAGRKLQLLSQDPLKILNNGNYVITGKCLGNVQYQWDGITPFYQAAVAEFDSNFNFKRGYCFKNSVESNSDNTRITMQPDGSGFFTMLDYISGYTADVYSVQFKDGQILKQRKRHYIGEGIPIEPEVVRLPDGGDMIVRLLGDSISNIPKIEFLKMHLSDTSSACLGMNDNSTYLYNYIYEPIQLKADSVHSNVFKETNNKTLIAKDAFINKLPACFQVSHCDSLKLVPSAIAVCLSQNLQVISRKNLGCGSNVFWQYDTSAISSAVQSNDSTVSFKFKVPWSGYIYGSILGCSTIIDSIHINVLQAPIKLNLGSDTAICPNNTIVLNAHAGYAAYRWQDGSTDSIFLAKQTGTYFVQVTDACGGYFQDTVIVKQQTATPISIGADRIKCNGDTLHLNAPVGFINYQWSPNYKINSINNPSVVVSPLVDTNYIIKAEKPLGCFSFDTVKITVMHSPPINLGNDTSFCNGQMLKLDAGIGFNSYQWSDGSINQTITVSSAGIYSVIGTSLQGCKSSDTLRVANIYALPIIALNHNSGLCTGSNRVLDAGIFTKYIWQDGSTARTFIGERIGIYYVNVTDKNGCNSSDTARITTLFPLPKDFLTTDTVICSYGTVTLQPLKDYASYLWNSGKTSRSIIIDQPGIYWLQVRDNSGCSAKDSINVVLKQCMAGLYVPTAFTPNGDGKNDKLRALLFGNIQTFDLTIYNRFGQMVFETKDNMDGWDGRINGQQQAAETYVWICKYQLVGDPKKVERGTAVLIR